MLHAQIVHILFLVSISLEDSVPKSALNLAEMVTTVAKPTTTAVRPVKLLIVSILAPLDYMIIRTRR